MCYRELVLDMQGTFQFGSLKRLSRQKQCPTVLPSLLRARDVEGCCGVFDCALTVRACKTFHKLTTLHFSQIKLTSYRNSIAFITLTFPLLMLTLHRCWDFSFISEFYGMWTLSFNLNVVVSQFLNPFGFSFPKEIFWACFSFLFISFCVLYISAIRSSIPYYLFPLLKVWQDPLF